MYNTSIAIILIVFVMTFMPHFRVFSQDRIITTKIIDSKSKTPIPFASIRIITNRGSRGVVSNADGDFQIPSMYRSIADTLQISCIGYRTKNVLIRELRDDILNIIGLEDISMQLSEVVVHGKRLKRVTAKYIVENAIQNISINYPTKANSYIAYYRDYQREDDKYINLNEAIVEISDEGFNSNDQLHTTIGLLDYRKNEEFKRDTTTDIAYDNGQGNKFIPGAVLTPFGGNELSILRMHDAIRNSHVFSYSFVNEFDRSFINNHRFRFSEVVYLDSLPLYNITFHSRLEITGPRHYAEGHIYIEKENFSIHQFEYTTYQNENSKTQRLYTVRVEYSKDKSIMHLNYISFNNLFKIRDPLDFKVEDILFDRNEKTFTVKFNHIPDIKSAANFKNYNFTFDNSRLKITKVVTFTDRSHEKEVRVHIEKDLPLIREEEIVKRMNVEVTGVLDIGGREVNIVHHIPVNQFRELFVQTQTDPGQMARDTMHIQKNIPLSKNKLRQSIENNSSNYWMNTPLEER